ncbi:MAG: type II toxin-antitoxin system VapC family toxin [Chloroflexota bacterium]
MIVLDTTVLVYATGTEHPLRTPCRLLIDLIAQGKVEATTTPEVIQEYAHVRARRLTRPEAARTARDFAGLLRPLLTVDASMLTMGLRIFEQTPAIGSFDAVLAAASIALAADALVSADRGFANIKELRYLDPAVPDLLERVDIA